MSIVRSLIVLVVFASLSFAEPIPKAAKAKRDYFPTTVGSRWEYVIEGTDTLDHVREVMSEEKKGDGSRTAEFKWTSHANTYTDKSNYRIDKAGVFRLGWGPNSAFAIPCFLWKADAKNGDVWDGGITLPERTYTMKRCETETIETPAGKLEAIPISIQGPDGFNKYWYAADIGMVKWVRPNRTIVLSKFTPGKVETK